MLPAHADLQPLFASPGPVYGRLHQPSHSLDIDNLKRVVLEHAQPQIGGQELLLGVLPAERIHGLGQVVGPK